MYEGQKRLIQIVSIQNNEVLERQSSATTWGALKEEFPEIAMASRGSNAWLKVGKVDLTSDQTPLPNNGEPVVIYLYVEKMKAGGEMTDKVMESVDEQDKQEAEEMLSVIEEVVDYLVSNAMYV